MSPRIVFSEEELGRLSAQDVATIRQLKIKASPRTDSTASPSQKGTCRKRNRPSHQSKFEEDPGSDSEFCAGITKRVLTAAEVHDALLLPTSFKLPSEYKDDDIERAIETMKFACAFDMSPRVPENTVEKYVNSAENTVEKVRKFSEWLGEFSELAERLPGIGRRLDPVYVFVFDEALPAVPTAQLAQAPAAVGQVDISGGRSRVLSVAGANARQMQENANLLVGHMGGAFGAGGVAAGAVTLSFAIAQCTLPLVLQY
eukprot:CAMPEP_0181324562 /NCGR_PEP_ID=MMETSP1101-20121128/20430_1 /TAXON_ID=46948 /ORGANISM="Rhodomonas abbreviata, Strain Caron Lab Isolate" /LENGTH=257 /DNA_ID=CAMNT_0023432755 /DNA_START=47 /DNA_END=821 /DNA_ORIENTATION=-